jgi:hypothetical protein
LISPLKKEISYPNIVREDTCSQKGSKSIAELDPNHNFFILVDDGSENTYGGEIKFRADLENELRKGKSQKYYENRRKRTNSNENISDNENSQEDYNTVELIKGLKKDIIPMVLIVVQVCLLISQ